MSSAALATDGTIYVGSCDGFLYALNPDGTLQWNFVAGEEIASSPVLGTDGTIYVGSGSGDLYALDPADGSSLWQYPTTQLGIYPSPALSTDGTTIYVGANDNNLYALNTANSSAQMEICHGNVYPVLPGGRHGWDDLRPI